MNITHVVERLSLLEGGVARCITDAVAILERRGHQCRILTANGADLPPNWSRMDSGRYRSIEHPRVPFGHLLVGNRRELREWLEQSDVIHLHMPWAPWLLQVADMAQRSGKATCISLHGMLDRWSMQQGMTKKWIHLAIAGRRVIERANAVHFTAEAEALQGVEWARPRKIEIIPCPVDLTSYRALPGSSLARERLGIPPEARGVLYLSRIHPKKGLAPLIEAFAALPRPQSFELWIAGDQQDQAYWSACLRLLDRLGLTNRIRVLGHVEGSTKLSLYQAAEVLALPTYQENFGLVLFEAALCGTPVLTTNLADTWKELERGAGASIVRQDPESISRGLWRVLGQSSIGTRPVNARGRDWAMAWLNEDRIGGAIEKMYRDAIESERGLVGR